MRGLPKFFNTKEDYLNCIELFGMYGKQKLKEAYDNRFIWQETELVGDGVEDETHKIIIEEEDKDGNKLTSPIRHQYEFVEDSNAYIFRIGFTKEEIETLIK